MSAFPNSKLDAELVNKAVASLLKYESKKAAGSNGKQALLSGYAKPVLVQVPSPFRAFHQKPSVNGCITLSL